MYNKPIPATATYCEMRYEYECYKSSTWRNNYDNYDTYTTDIAQTAHLPWGAGMVRPEDARANAKWVGGDNEDYFWQDMDQCVSATKWCDCDTRAGEWRGAPALSRLGTGLSTAHPNWGKASELGCDDHDGVPLDPPPLYA